MTEPQDTTHTPPPSSPLAMTPAEVRRNIALKTSQRPPVDSQGRPIAPPATVEWHYDERGRITGSTTTPLEQPAPINAEDSPVMQAMRAKAARNAEELHEFRDRTKREGSSWLGGYQH